ncbi:MAG TPA: hypothetical protein VEL76_11670 [Gemmataceae bacterium]|nr:hypothetical protein [Gemmataceae bacterium]
MKTLAGAWNWYEATKRNLRRMWRLGSKYWAHPSLKDASIWQDDQFRMLEASDIVAETTASLDPIDDLAVIVLFSVFESQVRDHLALRLKPEKDTLKDPILTEAAADALRGVEEGSFYRRVLCPLQAQGLVPPDLVEQVNQVRKYRNWAAHGRRERDAEMSIGTPDVAYKRLKDFLAKLGIAIEVEERESGGAE